jgi:hypothetical protein
MNLAAALLGPGYEVVQVIERKGVRKIELVVNDKVHISRAGERQGERTGVLAARLM